MKWNKLVCFSSLVLVAALFNNEHSALAQAKPSLKSYFAELDVYSIKSNEGIDSIEGVFGGSGCGPGGTFSTSIRHGLQETQVSLQGLQKEGRFIVKLVASRITNAVEEELPELTKDYDVTDMVPKTIEIARDAEGRIFNIRIVPKVNTAPAIRQLITRDLKLTHFGFDGSPVVLDDQEYLGTMSMFSGEMVLLDIADLAKVEFSLVPFRGATEQGQLLDGTIDIHHDGHDIRIQRVSNGVNPSKLEGGPYAIYVRWSEPTYSGAEVVQQMFQQLAELRRQQKKGEGNIPEEKLNSLERNLEKRRFFMNYGLGPIEAKDRL